MKLSRLVGVIALALAGCAGPQSKYEWGNYEQALYSYYKNPAEANALMVSISTAITSAEASKRVVAPGLYAEYGYLLLMQGKTQDAIDYFDKEQAKWPESAHLMERMRKLAQSQTENKGGAKL
jgi:hypothetical protein